MVQATVPANATKKLNLPEGATEEERIANMFKNSEEYWEMTQEKMSTYAHQPLSKYPRIDTIGRRARYIHYRPQSGSGPAQPRPPKGAGEVSGGFKPGIRPDSAAFSSEPPMGYICYRCGEKGSCALFNVDRI